MFFALLQCKRLPFLNAIGSPKIPISFIAKDTRLPFCKSKNVEKGQLDISIQERSNFWNIGKCNSNSLSLAVQVFSGQDGNFSSPEPDEEIGHDFAGNSNGNNSKGGGGGGGGGGSRRSGGGEMEESELNWLESWKNILAGVAYSLFRSIWNYGGSEIEVKLVCTAVNLLLHPILMPIFEEIAGAVLSISAKAILLPLILIPIIWFSPVILISISILVTSALAQVMLDILLIFTCFCLLILLCGMATCRSPY